MPKSELRYHSIANPFPGLRAFKDSESHLFFGREENIFDVISKLERNHFVAVVGTSGTGKSSLIKAGVLPAIESKKDDSNAIPWELVTINPGNSPILNLTKAIGNNHNLIVADKKEDFEKSLFDLMSNSTLGLVQGMRPILNRNSALLILIDQFEEVFRFANDDNAEAKKEYDQFVNLIIETVRQRDVPIYVILTLRSDFLGDCVAFDGLPEAINDGHYLVPRMTKVQMKRAITGPIDLAEGKISPRLVQHITNDLGTNPDQLPILQHAMMRCWDYWKMNESTGEPMDLKHFEAIGDLENALSNDANEAYQELTEAQQLLVEKIFKSLTTKKDDNRGVRRPMSLHQLTKICESTSQEILDCLEPFRKVGRSFILPGIEIDANSNTVFDISHESLMRGWDRLRIWVDEEAESAEFYNRICTSAVLFKKDASALWRNPELQLALDWKIKQKPILAWGELYNPEFELSLDFIENSRLAYLAEKRKKNNRTKIIRFSIAAFILVISILAGWAMFQTNIANKKTDEAEKNSQLALEQKSLAETAKEEALSASNQAKRNSKIAEEQARIAADQAKRADEQKSIAEIERTKALASAQEAQNKQQLANLKSSEAILQKQKADAARNEATRLRMLAISQNLAHESTQITRDANLAAVLSILAYDIASANNGNTNDVSIFDASIKSLTQISKEYSPKIMQHPNKLLSLMIKNNELTFVDNSGIFYAHSTKDFSLIKKITTKLNPLEIDQSFINPYRNEVAFGLNNFAIQLVGETVNEKAALGHSGLIRAAVFRNTIPTMISGGRDNKLIFWNSTIAEVEVKLEARIKTISSLTSANIIYVGCENGIVYRVNIDNKKSEVFASRTNSRVEVISQSDDGLVIVVGYSDGITQVYSKSGSLLKEIAGEGSVAFLKIDRSHDLLVIASAGRLINLYTLSDLSKLPRVINSEGVIKEVDIDKITGELYLFCSDRSFYRYATRADWYIDQLRKKAKRKLTTEEWETYLGKDIPYYKINPDQINSSER